MTGWHWPVLLAVWAVLFALVEIEIEGEHGWAARLPTWQRPGGIVDRLTGRPLTGYHLFMVPITVVALHFPFAGGLDWTWRSEALVIASLLAWTIAWDYLWFVLNPSFGPLAHGRDDVWWYPRRIGRVPLDYVTAIGASLVLAVVADGLAAHGRVLAALGATIALALALHRPYARWYRRMRA